MSSPTIASILNIIQLASMSSPMVKQLSRDQIKEIGATNIRLLVGNIYAMTFLMKLSSSQVASLNPRLFSQGLIWGSEYLGSTFYEGLSAEQIQAFAPENLGYWGAAALAALQTNTVKALTTNQLGRLGGNNLGILINNLEAMTFLMKLSSSQVASLNPRLFSQGLIWGSEYLGSTFYEGLSAEQIQAFAPENLGYWGAAALAALQTNTVKALTTNQLGRLGEEIITTDPINAAAFINHLTIAQINHLNRTFVDAASKNPTNIGNTFFEGLHAYQIDAGFSVKGLRSEQLGSLLAPTVQKLNSDQLNAINLELLDQAPRSAQWRILANNIVLTNNVWSFFARLSNTQIQSLSLEMINNLSSKAPSDFDFAFFGHCTTEQTQALNLAQWPLQAIHKLSANQISALSATQLRQIAWERLAQENYSESKALFDQLSPEHQREIAAYLPKIIFKGSSHGDSDRKIREGMFGGIFGSLTPAAQRSIKREIELSRNIINESGDTRAIEIMNAALSTANTGPALAIASLLARLEQLNRKREEEGGESLETVIAKIKQQQEHINNIMREAGLGGSITEDSNKNEGAIKNSSTPQIGKATLNSTQQYPLSNNAQAKIDGYFNSQDYMGFAAYISSDNSTSDNLQNARLTQSQLEQLLGSADHDNVAAIVAYLCPHLLENLRLSQEQLNLLIARSDNNSPALANIAQYVPHLLQGLKLSQKQFDLLLDRGGNSSVALGNILQNLPSLISGLVMNLEQIMDLCESPASEYILSAIKRCQPQLLHNLRLNQVQLNHLLQTDTTGLTLENVVRYAPQLLNGLTISPEQLEAILRRDQTGNSLAIISQNTPTLLAKVRLSQKQFDNIFLQDKGLESLEKIMRHAPNLLRKVSISYKQFLSASTSSTDGYVIKKLRPNSTKVFGKNKITQKQFNEIINTDTDGKMLENIAHYSPEILSSVKLSQEQLDRIIVNHSNRKTLRHISQKLSQLLKPLHISQVQLNQILLGDPTGKTLANISIKVPEILRSLRVCQDQLDLIMRHNPSGEVLMDIMRSNPNIFKDLELNQMQFDDLLEADINLSALEDLAKIAPKILKNVKMNQGQLDLALKRNPIGIFSWAILHNANHLFADVRLSQPQLNRIFEHEDAGLIVVRTAKAAPQLFEGIQLTQSQLDSIPNIFAIARANPFMVNGLRTTIRGNLDRQGDIFTYYPDGDLFGDLNGLAQNLAHIEFDQGIFNRQVAINLEGHNEANGVMAIIYLNRDQPQLINKIMLESDNPNLRVNITPPDQTLSPLRQAFIQNPNDFYYFYKESFSRINPLTKEKYQGKLNETGFIIFSNTEEGRAFLRYLQKNYPKDFSDVLFDLWWHGSRSGLPAIFHTVEGAQFWNDLILEDPKIAEPFTSRGTIYLISLRLSGWPVQSLQNLAITATELGESGFLGAIAKNPVTAAALAKSLSNGFIYKPSLFNTFAERAPFALHRSTAVTYFDLTNGHVKPFSLLTGTGLRNIIASANPAEQSPILEYASPEQLSAIPWQALATLNHQELSLLPTDFWRAVTSSQLRGILQNVDITLGSNSIGLANFQAISANTLVETLKNGNANWRLQFQNQQQDMTDEQRTALLNAGIINIQQSNRLLTVHTLFQDNLQSTLDSTIATTPNTSLTQSSTNNAVYAHIDQMIQAMSQIKVEVGMKDITAISNLTRLAEPVLTTPSLAK